MAFLPPEARIARGVLADRFAIEGAPTETVLALLVDARDRLYERRVTLELPRASVTGDPVLLQTYVEGARAASALEHAGVVRVHSVEYDTDGAPFVVRERVRGALLSTRPVPMSLDAAWQILDPVIEAMAAAHALGLVHGALRPAQIVLHENARGALRPKITGFGSAPLLSRVFGAAGPVAPRYAAPELFRGAAPTTASDVWSIGVVACELLTGAHPIELGGATLPADVARAVTGGTPRAIARLAPGAPADVARALDRALAVAPEARWPNAGALQAALVDRTRALVAAGPLGPAEPRRTADAGAPARADDGRAGPGGQSARDDAREPPRREPTGRRRDAEDEAPPRREPTGRRRHDDDREPPGREPTGRRRDTEEERPRREPTGRRHDDDDDREPPRREPTGRRRHDDDDDREPPRREPTGRRHDDDDDREPPRREPTGRRRHDDDDDREPPRREPTGRRHDDDDDREPPRREPTGRRRRDDDEPVPLPRGRSGALAPVAVVAALALGGLAVWLATRAPPPPPAGVVLLANVPSAGELRVDGAPRPPGAGGRLELAPGPHRLEVEGFEPLDVEVREGETVRVELVATPPPAPVVVAPAAPLVRSRCFGTWRGGFDCEGGGCDVRLSVTVTAPSGGRCGSLEWSREGGGSGRSELGGCDLSEHAATFGEPATGALRRVSMRCTEARTTLAAFDQEEGEGRSGALRREGAAPPEAELVTPAADAHPCHGSWSGFSGTTGASVRIDLDALGEARCGRVVDPDEGTFALSSCVLDGSMLEARSELGAFSLECAADETGATLRSSTWGTVTLAPR